MIKALATRFIALSPKPLAGAPKELAGTGKKIYEQAQRLDFFEALRSE